MIRAGVVIVMLTALGMQSAGAAGVAAKVETDAGPVRGISKGATLAYLGIPYAEPPVGELRWQPPQPHRPWQAVLDATRFGAHCLQASLGYAGAFSEDCLFLNVFAPKSAGDLKPVMVWIHGGANYAGRSGPYDPTPLIQSGDVVVVTLNYRLGVFGFLAHPALDSEGHPAVNYGILDQQLALKWVRNNIERFGGDPRNVTIFGESAGGLNSLTHLVSPLSAGLFDRAIVQSGAYQLDTPSLAASEERGVAFAARAGCADRAAACLRALPAQTLLDLAKDKPFSAIKQSTVDGKILVETQRSALEAGRINRVAVMQGSNRDEARDFNCGAQAANELLGKWVPVYAYEFADPASTDMGGATHALELKYLFHLIVDRPDASYKPTPEVRQWRDTLKRPLSKQSAALAEVMRTSWTNFARSGQPQSFLLPSWPIASQGIQVFELPRSHVASPADFIARHQCTPPSGTP